MKLQAFIRGLGTEDNWTMYSVEIPAYLDDEMLTLMARGLFFNGDWTQADTESFWRKVQ